MTVTLQFIGQLMAVRHAPFWGRGGEEGIETDETLFVVDVSSHSCQADIPSLHSSVSSLMDIQTRHLCLEFVSLD